jgi:hypothetical protein
MIYQQKKNILLRSFQVPIVIVNTEQKKICIEK